MLVGKIYISQDFYTLADEINIANFDLIKSFLLIRQTIWHTIQINTKIFIVTPMHNIIILGINFNKNNIKFFIMYLSAIEYSYHSYLITVNHITYVNN